jgi:hypothetical protein
MKAHQIINYDSILQTLDQPGCPFCRYMKNYQSALMQEPAKKDLRHLCSFHTWGLAATQRATSAAQLFLTLLNKPSDANASLPCDICVLLNLEDDRRVREFISCQNHKLVTQWLRSHAALCISHGTKLKHGASALLSTSISSILEDNRNGLIQELTRLLSDEDSTTPNWGVLGHAAEFLVSQRGLRP